MCRGMTSNSPALDFSMVMADAESRVGRISVRGRYHGSKRAIADDYAVTNEVLGKGCSGPIHLATSICDIKRKFAVKSFNLATLRKIEREHLKGELAIFLCMDHPHVGRLVDIYENEHTLKLVMECIDGGELLTRITQKKRFVEPEAADTMRQILLAVNYLHTHGIVHRDLKLENFLYDGEDSNHLKLIDFGFSKFFTRGRLKSTCGTLAYVAPEVLGESYGSQCDLWSAGVIAYVLLSGTMPFYGSKETKLDNISHGRYKMHKDVWDPLSSKSKEFVQCLLDTDPKVRLTAKQALAHPWIKERRGNAPMPPPRHVLNALSSWKSAPKLQRACLTLMAWSLNQEEHVKFRDYFLALDIDHDGAISLEELRRVMGKCRINTSKVEQVFNSISSNDDDEIHYSEFVAALMSDQVVEIQDDHLRATFRKFDKNNLGYITGKDFSSVVGFEYDGTKSSELLLEADTLEHDGRVDYHEFVQYVRSCSSNTTSGDKCIKHKSPVENFFNPRPMASRSGKVMDADLADQLTEKQVKKLHKQQQTCCTLM